MPHGHGDHGLLVGSKFVLQVWEILHQAYGERFRPPALLQQRVKAGLVGGRAQRGWHSKA